MMKYKKFIVLIMLLVLLVIPNIKVEAASQTLGDLKNELKDLEAKAEQRKNEKKKTEAEIAANKRKLQEADYKLEQTKKEIEELQNEILKTNEEIAKVKSESEDLLILYQKLQSENVYMSYITGASSMTELIMRIDAINQIADYNEQKLNELEMLIKNNEKLDKELDKYQVKLNDDIKAYNEALDALGDELADIEEGAVSLDKQIASLKDSIKSYENLGCKDDQILTVCVNVINSNGWLKPVSKGRITSLYGIREGNAIVSSNHRGIDIGVSEGTQAYATAAGTVGAIVRKASCGGNMVYVWAYVNGKPYTYVFMHLKEILVNVGDAVTVNTVIGLSGGGSTAVKNGGYDRCTTGAHLHYGLAEGGFYNSSNFNSHTINPPGYPGLYQWFYSR